MSIFILLLLLLLEFLVQMYRCGGTQVQQEGIGKQTIGGHLLFGQARKLSRKRGTMMIHV